MIYLQYESSSTCFKKKIPEKVRPDFVFLTSWCVKNGLLW